MANLQIPTNEVDSIASNSTNASYNSNGEHVIHKIHTSNDGHIIHLGKQKFFKQDLIMAFGGTLQSGWAPPPVHKFGNPAPLGLSAFALTMFVMGLVQSKAMGVSNTNIVIGLAMLYGGLIQLLTGMWEMALENTFAATMLTSYAGFWITQAVPAIPFFHIDYDLTKDKNHSFGFVYLGWFLFNTMLTLCTMKSTLALFSFCALFDVYLLLCTIASMGQHSGVFRAAGVVGVIVSFLGWYNAYAGVANGQNAYFSARPFPLPNGEKDEADFTDKTS